MPETHRTLRLIVRGDERYAEARRLWNGLLDPRPAAIAECFSTSDVVRAVAIARDRQWTISVRGGGHGVAGRACRDDALVIDLRMRDVTVDPERLIARAGGGATWNDFDRATAAHGLATTGGLISSTGIGGLTLGGGIGWLMRRWGLACDNLLGAEIVTADGRVRRVSGTENGDLFWALRGAGIGLGAVTSLEYALHPVRDVLAGMVMHSASRAAEVLRFFRDLCVDAPDALTALVAFSFAPPAPFVPPELRGKPVVVMAVCWSGDLTDGERIVAPIRTFGPPLADIIGTMRYADLQTMLDAGAPPHHLNYWKSAFVPSLDEETIDLIVARGTALPSPLAQLHVHQLGGAVARVSPGSTAFDQRSSPFLVNIPTMWTAPEETEAMIEWTRDTHARIARAAETTAYLNFQDRDENPASAWTAATNDRLRAIKEACDPSRLFGDEPLV
ncbi:MAG: FAD-binding oxidoreductase [Acidobacteriota bacterium]|nr:FAD-binding oxidoreductase [Acidobacteriota bacterium]